MDTEGYTAKQQAAPETHETQTYVIPLSATGEVAHITIPRPLEPRHMRAVRRWSEFMVDFLAEEAECAEKRRTEVDTLGWT